MNAIELKAIVNYLIESYCDNVNGDFRYTIREKDVHTYFGSDETEIRIWYTHTIDAAGCIKQTYECFSYIPGEKLTTLETYVNEALDRIYKAELIDNRKDDPAMG